MFLIVLDSMQVVRCASTDTLPMVGQLIPLMINKLNETLAGQATTPEALERQSEIQVCILFQSVSSSSCCDLLANHCFP